MACSSPPEGKHFGNASITQLKSYLLLITPIFKYHKYSFIIKGKNPVQQKKQHLLQLNLYFYVLILYKLRTRVAIFVQFQQYFYESIFYDKKWH